MKQVININFQGRVVPIEVSAYDILKEYIDSLSRHFAAEDGKDEIINDIENRIGELFQERIKTGATCITDDDVNAIIKSIGRPEDFDDSEASSATESTKSNSSTDYNTSNASYTTSGKRRLFRDENHKLVGGVCSGIANYFDIDLVIVRVVFLILLFSFGIGFIPYIILWIAVPSSATTVIGSRRKKLYRDNDEKYVAGVCSGIGHYLGINAWIPRVLFLLPLLSFLSRSRWNYWGDFGDFNFFSFSPGALFIYIILWLVVPEAKTTAEKLEMKGEKVDMNSIKESVVEEMKGVQQRAQKFGKEIVGVANEKGKTFGTEASSIARKSGRSFGDIIAFLVKMFVYFILIIVGISLIFALFGFGIAAMGVFPMKDFLLTQGWQNAFAWGTLIFFIIVPMIAVITWIIRKLARIKAGSKLLSLGFSAMWVVGWVSIILLVSSLAKDFRYSSNINEQEISLTNPAVSSLEITTLAPGARYTRNSWFSIEPFQGTDEDTAVLRNTSVHIMKSTTDSFKVSLIKLANGNNRRNADTLASIINFNVEQKDSLLVIDRGITINKTDKFRNQHVIVTVYVPIGKKIKVNGRVNRYNNIKFDGPFTNNWDDDNDNIQFENLEKGWQESVWYIMTKDGLQTLDGKPADEYRKNDSQINNDGIDIREGNNRVRINENGITVEDNTDGSYRYDETTPKNKIDSIKMNLQKEEKRFKDSLQKEKEKIEKQLEKYQDKEDNTFNFKSLPFHNAMVICR